MINLRWFHWYERLLQHTIKWHSYNGRHNELIEYLSDPLIKLYLSKHETCILSITIGMYNPLIKKYKNKQYH